MGYLNGHVNITDIFQELKSRGYVHEDKRSKQSEGMKSIENYKWIFNHKKAVNDAYSGGKYITHTPEFFYAALAYVIHRKKKNISSWTEMMLMESIDRFVRQMNKLGSEVSFKECEKLIDTLANQILEMYFRKPSEEPKANPFANNTEQKKQPYQVNEFFKYIQDLLNTYPLSLNLEMSIENLYPVYKAILLQIHPDIVNENLPQGEEREIMTKKVNTLFDEIPEDFKTVTAFNLFFRNLVRKAHKL